MGVLDVLGWLFVAVMVPVALITARRADDPNSLKWLPRLKITPPSGDRGLDVRILPGEHWKKPDS